MWHASWPDLCLPRKGSRLSIVRISQPQPHCCLPLPLLLHLHFLSSKSSNIYTFIQNPESHSILPLSSANTMAFSRETKTKTKTKLASIASTLAGSSSSSSGSASTNPTQASVETTELESPAPISYRDSHETKGHSTALDLSMFANLPYDVRLMIWEASFISRQIPIICETVQLTTEFNPPFKRISVSRDRLKVGSPPGPEYTSFLTVCAPLLLQIGASQS